MIVWVQGRVLALSIFKYSHVMVISYLRLGAQARMVIKMAKDITGGGRMVQL